MQWDAEVIRFFFSMTHYRSPPDFTKNALTMAKNGLERIHRIKEKLVTAAGDYKQGATVKLQNDKDDEYYTAVHGFRKKFEESMDDDFNTPEAIAALFEFVKATNKYLRYNTQKNEALCAYALQVLNESGNVLTLTFEKHVEGDTDAVIALAKKFGGAGKGTIEEILEIREEARQMKDWVKADAIRDELLNLGYEVQDTVDGPKWRRK
jgi:cysteinyl-tRNA synthetase